MGDDISVSLFGLGRSWDILDVTFCLSPVDCLITNNYHHDETQNYVSTFHVTRDGEVGHDT